MPDLGFAVVLRTTLDISLSAIRQRFPSITFTSRRHSPRGDDNLQQAGYYLQVTEEQLNTIYNASREANETFVEEITKIEDRLDDLNSLFDTVKRARGGQSTFKQTLQRLGNDATTKDILVAARELSEKAKYTSSRVALTDSSNTSITLQTAPSSEYSVVPNDELTSEAAFRGINFSFGGQPTADDARKIEGVLRLVDSYSESDDDSMEEPGSVRGLRSRKSDLSTYYFHIWSEDAYKTKESRLPSEVTCSQSPSQSSVNVLNIQPNDSSTVSDAISNFGVSSAGRGLQDTPPLLAVHESPCPSCRGSRGVEAMQTSDTSPKKDAAVVVQSAPERHSLATMSSQSQNSTPGPAVPASGTHPDEADIRQASPLTKINSHCMIVNGPATVLSPTMNIQSPGATGARNTYFDGQPAHCPSPQAFAQSRDLEGPRFGCKEFGDSSVSCNSTSDDASGAYNQDIPAAES